jgi:hypothetical protein
MVQRKDVSTDEIVRLYQSGLIGREIAEKLECSVALVQQRLFRAGIKMRPSNDRITAQVDKTVLKEMYWDKEMHPAKIGKVFGIHKNTVIKKMLEFGIEFRTKSEARLGKLNPLFGIGHTDETRQKMSDVVFDGSKDITSSHNNIYGKRVEYKDCKFRSRWEYGFALHLDRLGIEWEYETRRIKYLYGGIYRTYVPDFFLPSGLAKSIPCYVEIKGFCDAAAEQKIEAIKRQINNLVILYRDDLIELELIDASGRLLIGET